MKGVGCGFEFSEVGHSSTKVNLLQVTHNKTPRSWGHEQKIIYRYCWRRPTDGVVMNQDGNCMIEYAISPSIHGYVFE